MLRPQGRCRQVVHHVDGEGNQVIVVVVDVHWGQSDEPLFPLYSPTALGYTGAYLNENLNENLPADG